MEQRHKLIGLVGITAIAGASLVAYAMPIIKANAKTSREILIPASNLAKLQEEVKSTLLNVEFVPSSDQPQLDPIVFFHPSGTDLNTVYQGKDYDAALMNVAANPAFRSNARTLAQKPPVELQQIQVRDILIDHRVGRVQAVARKMVILGKSAGAENNVKQALDYFQAASDLTSVIYTLGENPASVSHFGIKLDICDGVYQLLARPNLTVEEIASIDKFLTESLEPGSVNHAFDRTIRELIAVCRNLDAFDEEDFLSVNLEMRNPEPPVNHPKMKDAMEARLISFWQEATELADKEVDNEGAGVAFDYFLSEGVKIETQDNYMIRTLSTTYEQVGRNLARISQSRQVLRCLAAARKAQIQSGALPDALSNDLLDTTLGRDKVKVVYQKTQGGCQITARSSMIDDAEFKGRAFEVNQLAGVQTNYTSKN